ncbi:pyridoxamine 5'-phosphate oxidase family protein [Brevibacillus fluminis]|uniref:pyridoxamine 5'-phosphate oxidase family protein n=1 Tax=Brevibacillus fluminis TaxID=511487 RepID=UPI003F8923AD
MSKKEVQNAVSPELAQYLNGDKLVLLSTVDAETNTPSISAISWVKTVDPGTIRFAVAANSRIVGNVKANPRATICVIGLETVYSITGTVTVREEPMEGIQMKLVKLELSIDNIFESMFWGSKIVQEPAYEKTQMIEKSKELDEQVFQGLLR